MSRDLQRIVLTFVPSFDPCSQLPLSNLTSSAAPNSCSFLFISTPPTNRHRQVNISSIRSQNRCVNELLPYSDPLFLCRVNCVICIHHVFECVLYICSRMHISCIASIASLCSSTTSVSLHPSFIPPSLMASPLPPSLISLAHQWALSLRAKPGWTFEWRDGWKDGWMDWGRGKGIEGGGC